MDNVVKAAKTHIHGAKDSIQNESIREEASPSHVDTAAPPSAASPSSLTTVTQATDKFIRIPSVEAQTQQVGIASTNKDIVISPTTPSAISFQSTITGWPSPDKSTMSNSTTTSKQTPLKETASDPKANFSSPSTPIDPSPLGSFNQFPVNPEQTSTGQPNSPNNQAKAKPFVCGTCNQTFSRQHNLKSHALTHSQEKPFQCGICQHFFRRHHDLKRHAKLHTGEKPYQCQYCKRSFARLDALNRHLRAESFCGGPQKKLFQSSDSKSSEQVQQPPIQVSPQLTTPQPQLQNQSQPQSKSILQTQIEIPQESKSSPSSAPQQFKQTSEESHNKQSSNSTITSQSKVVEVSRQSQDYYKRQIVHQEQYNPWQHQQTATNQTISSSNVQSLQAKPVGSNLVIPNATHHQIVFPVETPTSIPANGATSHYQLQYSHAPSEFSVQISDSQRRVRDTLISGEQDNDGRSIHTKASSQMQLSERNKYLEDRVRELENEVINERKLRSRREYLEQRVTELEIEKNLLKSLLLELGPKGTSESAHIHEKKRKASSPIEPSNPSKHQKEGERIVITQSSQ